MNKVILDPILCTKLDGLQQPVELRDESGHTLGHLLPPDLYQGMLRAWSRARISDEELEHRIREPGGRSLAQIWQRLGKQV